MSEPKKHFDIAKDGGLPAQHTSRPVIVGRTNMVRDPMTVSDDPKTPASHKDLKITAPKEITPSETVSQAETTVPKQAQTDSKPTIDDSIVESKVPPPPNLTVDNPSEKLIKEKTYFLHIGRGDTGNRIRFIINIIFVIAALGIAAYVIIL